MNLDPTSTLLVCGLGLAFFSVPICMCILFIKAALEAAQGHVPPNGANQADDPTWWNGD
jgi:hypothetical protein